MDAKTIASLPPKLLAQYLRDPSLQMAFQQQQEGSDTSPVQHWTQGAARLAKGLLGGYNARQIQDQYASQAESAANERRMALSQALGRPAETEQIGDRTINWNTQAPNLMGAAANLSAPDNQDLGTAFIGAKFNQDQTAANQAFTQAQQERAFQQQAAMQERLFGQQAAMNNAQLERQMALKMWEMRNDPEKAAIAAYVSRMQGGSPATPSAGAGGINLNMTQAQATGQPPVAPAVDIGEMLFNKRMGIPNVENEFAKSLAKKDAETVDKARTSLSDTQDFSQNLASSNALLEKTPDWALGPVMGRVTSMVGYEPVANLESAQNSLTLQAKALLNMPSANFSDADRNFLAAISGGVKLPKQSLQAINQRLADIAQTAQSNLQGLISYGETNRTLSGYRRPEAPPPASLQGRVQVVDPNGRPFTIDASELQDALQNGWRQQ